MAIVPITLQGNFQMVGPINPSNFTMYAFYQNSLDTYGGLDVTTPTGLALVQSIFESYLISAMPIGPGGTITSSSVIYDPLAPFDQLQVNITATGDNLAVLNPTCFYIGFLVSNSSTVCTVYGTGECPDCPTPVVPDTNPNTYTLTYSDAVEGWPSFYSFFPEWILGMNNHLYTFKSGNLYRHNTNPVRNEFYGTLYPSSILSVFNDNPLENKLYKTMNLEGDAAWNAVMVTDLEYTGFINDSWFEKKEASYFAFVRNDGNTPANLDQYALRSLNGIGRSASTSYVGTTLIVNFSISPLVEIGSIISVGDMLYFSLPPYDTPQLAGEVTNINVDYKTGKNRILVDSSIPNTVPVTTQDPYFLYIKNSIAESHGVLGHYCVFNLINTSNSKVELFAVESDVMKSYP